MSGLRVAGGMWLVGGLSCAATAFGVLDEPPLLALMIAGSAVGFGVGTALLTGPGSDVVRWSNVAGVVWTIAFGALIVVEIAANMGYVRSAVWLTVWGALGALIAFRARRAVMLDGGAAR